MQRQMLKSKLHPATVTGRHPAYVRGLTLDTELKLKPRVIAHDEGHGQDIADGRRVTPARLAEMRHKGEPIVMVTAYDFPSAQVAEEPGVDIVLVGDTAAMVVLGYEATTPVGMDEMVTMGAAVRRGLRTPLLIGDMPFGSYESSNEHAIENA